VTTVAVVPVKRFGSAKSRLTDALSVGGRRALTEAMITDVLIALRRTPEIDVTLVVTGDQGAAALAGGYDALVVGDPDDAGHSAAARIGIRTAVEEHRATRVLLIPGDTPALDPADLADLLGHAPRAPSVVVVPDRHGAGTNALLLTPPEIMSPMFGPGSRARHEEAAVEAGAICTVVPAWSLVMDVDTGEDLDVLREALAGRPGGAAHVRGLLSQLARFSP
jgi:2-phospho-L-lactate/phosphoenolpyruvate guanylyltransferase